SARVQIIKSSRDFFRLNKRVRPMQQEYVEMIRVQSPEAAFDRINKVSIAEVIAARISRTRISLHTNPALRLNKYLISQRGQLAHRIAKDLFGVPSRIDVRVIKQRDALFASGRDQSDHGSLLVRAESARARRASELHATVGDSRNTQVSAIDLVGLQATASF